MLILASQSPRRREILKNAGIEFEIRVADVDESVVEGESPVDYVKRLALKKALAVRMNAGEIVLGADTTVVVDEHILAKPEDEADARRMLGMLAGRWHTVITGICLRHQGGEIVDAESTLVRFVAMTPDEIAGYAASGEPLDKAGAYGIQGLSSKFIDRIEGCYFNIVGLPVSLVWKHLKAVE